MGRFLVIVLVLAGCGKSGGNAHQALPTPYVVVDTNQPATIPVTALKRPAQVVWIAAAGSVELAEPPTPWTGAAPATRTTMTFDEAFSRLGDPPPPDETTPEAMPVRTEGNIKFARDADDPQLARQQAIEQARAAGILTDRSRGVGRADAAEGSRYPDTHPLVFAAPGTPATLVARLLVAHGGWLGVIERAGTLAALRIGFWPMQGITSAERQRWTEIHLGVNGVDVLALPSNTHTLLPWTSGAIDASAFGAIVNKLGADPNIDVLVTEAVTTQRLIETLVVLDQLGIQRLGLGVSPGPVDARLAQVVESRNKSAHYRSATATLTFGNLSKLGELERKVIRSVFIAGAAELAACYEPALAHEPSLTGTVRVHAFIGNTGTVKEVTASGLTPEIDSCVAGVIKRMRFPESGAAGSSDSGVPGVQLEYPMSFRPIGS